MPVNQSNLVAAEDPLSTLLKRLTAHFIAHQGLSSVVSQWRDESEDDQEWLENMQDGDLPAARLQPGTIKTFDPWHTSTSAMIVQIVNVQFMGSALDPTEGLLPFTWQMLRALRTAVDTTGDTAGKFLGLPFVHMVMVRTGQTRKDDGALEQLSTQSWAMAMQVEVTYIFDRTLLDIEPDNLVLPIV